MLSSRRREPAFFLVSTFGAPLLQVEPGLGPDAVKCRLTASARPAVPPTSRSAMARPWPSLTGA